MHYTNRHNPCPNCGSTSSSCKVGDSGRVWCIKAFSQADAAPGYRFIRPLANGMGGTLLPEELCFKPDREQRCLDKRVYRQGVIAKTGGRWEREVKPIRPVLSLEERARQYEQIYAQTFLRQAHQQKLIDERGLTTLDIALTGGVSTLVSGKAIENVTADLPGIDVRGERLIGANGILIWAYDIYGDRLGAQIAPDNTQRAKYLWLSSVSAGTKNQDRPGPALPDGALPLFAWVHPKRREKVEDGLGGVSYRFSPVSQVVLCEGALKSMIVAARLWDQGHEDVVVIGASGNHFVSGSSTDGYRSSQLGKWLEVLQPGEVVLAPDAGAINNKGGIPIANDRVMQLVRDLGHPMRVAWWEQEKKEQMDIDDLLTYCGQWSEMTYISCDEFFHLHPVRNKKRMRPGVWDGLTGVKWLDYLMTREVKKTGDTLTYDRSSTARLYTWLDPDTGCILLDTSTVGTGKSYDAGQIDEAWLRNLGAEQVVFLTADPMNVTTPTLQEWPVLRGRDQGRVYQEAHGEKQLRTYNPNKHSVDDIVIPANCAKASVIEELHRLRVDVSADTVCKGCPYQKQCWGGETDINYLHRRGQVLSGLRYIAHPNSIPEEFDRPTVIIADEAEALDWFENWEIDEATLIKTAVRVRRYGEVHPEWADECEEVFSVLMNLVRDCQADWGTHQTHEAIAEYLSGWLTRVMPEFISLLEKPDLRVLEQEQHLNGCGRSFGKRSTEELNQIIARNNHVRWMTDFVNGLKATLAAQAWDRQYRTGTVVEVGDDRTPWDATIHPPRPIPRCRVQISNGFIKLHRIRAEMVRKFTQENVVRVILLDATANPQFFERLFDEQVSLIQQEEPADKAQLNIVQFSGLGLNGKQKSDSLRNKSASLIDRLQGIYGDGLGVISGKESAKQGEGYWYKDTRGRNTYQECTELILNDFPGPNISAVADQYALLFGDAPDTSDTEIEAYPMWANNTSSALGSKRPVRMLRQSTHQGFSDFYRKKIIAEYEQALGRLRAIRRPGTTLTVFVLSDYPLPWDVELHNLNDFLVNSSESHIEHVLLWMIDHGQKVSCRRLAQRLGIAKSRVARSRTWQEYQARLQQAGTEVLTEEIDAKTEQSDGVDQTVPEVDQAVPGLSQSVPAFDVNLLEGWNGGKKTVPASLKLSQEDTQFLSLEALPCPDLSVVEEKGDLFNINSNAAHPNPQPSKAIDLSRFQAESTNIPTQNLGTDKIGKQDFSVNYWHQQALLKASWVVTPQSKSQTSNSPLPIPSASTPNSSSGTGDSQSSTGKYDNLSPHYQRDVLSSTGDRSGFLASPKRIESNSDPAIQRLGELTLKRISEPTDQRPALWCAIRDDDDDDPI